MTRAAALKTYADFEKPHETPVHTREECLARKVTHGGASIVFGKVKICLACHTEVTEQDLKDRVEAFGGPGHWIGCRLDKYHEGDCLV